MNVTGYQLKEAIRRWELRRDGARQQFADTLWRFEGETKPSPDEVMKLYKDAETAIAVLQTAQAEYNLGVKVDVQGHTVALAGAIKRLGGAQRAEKMWSEATASKNSRYYYDRDPRTKKTDEERAQAVLPLDQLLDRAAKAASFTGALRAAIAEGNSKEVEIAELDAALLRE
jgi:hypothetical protein